MNQAWANETMPKRLSKEDPKKSQVRLNSSQLFELFRRLDIDGDGELDIKEFLLVASKLDILDNSTDGKEYLAQIFGMADKDLSGKLSMMEFQQAYDLLFDRKLESTTVSSELFVRAIRYGRTKSQYSFELYDGDMTHFTSHATWFPTYTEEVISLTMDDIIAKIQSDAKKNVSEKHNVHWWIDITCRHKFPKIINTLIQKFGVPREVEPNFYGHLLSTEPKTRCRLAESTTVGSSTPTTSLNFFIQSMWLQNCPVVANIPRWVSDIQPRVLAGWLKFLIKRFSPFLSYKKSVDFERRLLLQRVADAMGDLCGYNCGLPFDVSADYVMPNFLLSSSDMTQRSPIRFVFDTLSLSLVNHNNLPPNCLITVHEIDDERDVHNLHMEWELEEKSSSGVVGRIVAGVRAKLYEVIQTGGISPLGHLVDTPINVAIMLIEELHDVSMGSMRSLDHWITCIERDTARVVVTKHNQHIRWLMRLIHVAENYVAPIHEALLELLRESPHNPLCKTFMGAAYSRLRCLIDGDATREKKGTSYWIHRLAAYRERVLEIKDEYHTKLDEQRNFWTYSLTLFSIFTFPVTFLTSYWGMNFENMGVPDDSAFKGVRIMWLAAGVMCFVIFVIVIRRRIIESAL